ncbi:putative bifunctional diguanylate cyclase/phosphodiesterase [Klebsiella aerogenes]|uniref:putative bifunctional diguanylate cyclase/phosphodiesterase n=1 Tax=Klebsiella aerogenes TaxID=548 RepID=UPI00351D65B3
MKSQLPEGTLLARIRTDKFVIIFPGILDEQQIEAYTQWLENLLLTSQVLDDVVEQVTRERLVSVLLNSSIACHNATEKGNGIVARFSTEMHDTAVNNVQLHQQLRYAVSKGEFHLVMQPIIDLSNPEMCTEGECLIRWQSKELGFVPPDKFIALAENTGLIVQIGRWVIETACRELSDFIRRGAPENFKLHVNISALQLKHPDFSQHLFDCIAQNNLSLANICIELTERVLVDDTGTAIALLTELRRKQITVALDDFGSGYSSLSYLHRLPFDCLKIDRNFVKDVLESEKSRTMISSVVSIAKGLNVPLIAEGIENAEVAEVLLRMGCEKAQGYYFGRPSSFNEWSVGGGKFRLEIGQ